MTSLNIYTRLFCLCAEHSLLDPPAPEVTLDVCVPNRVQNLVKHIMQVIQQLVKIKKMNGQHGCVFYQKSQTHNHIICILKSLIQDLWICSIKIISDVTFNSSLLKFCFILYYHHHLPTNSQDPRRYLTDVGM